MVVNLVKTKGSKVFHASLDHYGFMIVWNVIPRKLGIALSIMPD